MKILAQGTVAPSRYDSSSCIAGDVSSTAAPDSDASLSANWIRILAPREEAATTNQSPPGDPPAEQ